MSPSVYPSGRAHTGVWRTLLVAALIGGLAATAQAAPRQTTRSSAAHGNDVIVNGKRQPACAAKAAGAIDYSCLNGELKAAATAGQVTAPVVDATTSQANTPSKVGTFSYSATHERMGKNFGHSAQRYRPPAPNYSNAVTGTRPPK